MLIKDIKLNQELSGGNNVLRCELNYSKGGMSYFDYKNYPRGYYLNIRPMNVKLENGLVVESFTCFSGYKALCLQVQRKSTKSEGQALDIANEYIPKVVEMFVNQGKVVLANG